MLPNRVCADWQKYLYCYLSGTVMVTIENQWYSNETHCDQGTGSPIPSQAKHVKKINSNAVLYTQYTIGVTLR